ncbi:hypothetical protein JCM3774_000573 [Rhodotorula dairenensis]
MSSAAGQPKPVRPRRAARAPVRLGAAGPGDENSVAAAGVVPRAAVAAGKAALGVKPTLASSASVGAPQAVQVQVGKPGAQGPVPGVQTRRALGDVSNAAAGVRSDRAAAAPGVKPTTRSRPTSSNSFPAAPGQNAVAAASASTHAAFGRLRIDASAAVAQQQPTAAVPRAAAQAVAGAANAAAVKPRRAPSRAPTAGVAPSAPRIEQGEWAGASSASGYAPPVARNEHGAAAPVGLGIAGVVAPVAVAGAGHKRTHDVEFSDEEDTDHGAEAAQAFGPQAHGHAHPHGAVRHEGKVRVVDASGQEQPMAVDPDDWLMQLCDPEEAEDSELLIAEIKREFQEEIDYQDISMVAEYSEDVFKYMGELEESSMPNPRYMDHQSEIEWSMRTTLIDWLLQVHARYHMLPETLWIAINIIDRFLSNRVVSLLKFQLVGVTAMFVAAKYEEIMAPSVDEFVYMTEGGYSREEILKGERIILQSLEFNISSYCSPYSWVRRISKADDYDIQTRTLSKFLMEVTLLDHRFLRAKPSMIAAIGMYLARRMLGGDWNESFIFYSSFTEAHLLVPAGFLLESIAAPGFEERFVYRKYSTKKFLKASIFARNWARQNAALETDA